MGTPLRDPSLVDWSPPAGVASGDDLVVVSNRQPYSHKYEDGDIYVDRPVGGLSEALDEVLRRTGGAWVAWGDGDADRAAVDDRNRVAVPPDDPAYELRRVWLTDREVEGYYLGFSNQVLWPLCHDFVGRVYHDHDYWERYRSVNRKFAEAATTVGGAGSLVWFQDYHLALAPRMLRSLVPNRRLVHFWHIPWPPAEVFELSPHAPDLLDGLLGNDLLGFHHPSYREHFLECADRLLEGATVDWNASSIHYDGRTTRIESFPLGVPVERIHGHARSDGDAWEALPGGVDLSDRRVAIGVDRLDYTKGIVERLRGLERFWEQHPEWRGRLSYVQIASESRSEIPAYREVQREVIELVDHIDSRFGTDDWQPVVFTTKTLPKETLCRQYRHSDLALVTPLRDGMNLVAQEFVAANFDADAALVLGRGAGSHNLLGEGALTVTPLDPDEIAGAVHAALTMAPEERRRRMQAMRQRVVETDIGGWPQQVLGAADVQAGRRRIPR